MSQFLSLTFPTLAHDWLKYEQDSEMNRKAISIPAGTGVIKTGTVMGVITGTNNAVPYDPTASDGHQTVAGILLNGIDASGSTAMPGVICTRELKVNPLKLTWGSAVNTPTLVAAALEAMASALNIQTVQVA